VRAALPREEAEAVRVWEVSVLGRVPELAQRTLPELIEIARRDPALHADVLLALGELAQARAVPGLVEFIAASTRASTSEVRARALAVLARIAPRDAELAPALARSLEDSDLREEALQAAQGLASVDVPVAPESLLGCLAGTPLERRLALGVLGAQPGLPAEVLEAVRSRLEDEDPLVRVAAAGALVRLDAAAPELADRLLDTALGSDEALAQAAAGGLVAARDRPRVRELLRARLALGSAETRLRAAQLALRIDRGDAAALRTLLGALEEKPALADDVLGRTLLGAPFAVAAPPEREALLAFLERSGPRARPELGWLQRAGNQAEPELAARIEHTTLCIRGLARP